MDEVLKLTLICVASLFVIVGYSLPLNFTDDRVKVVMKCPWYSNRCLLGYDAVW